MKTNTVWKSFLSDEQTLGISHTYRNGVYYHLILVVENTIYAEHIKDLCIEHIHPLFESLSEQHMSITTIEALMEDALQQVNHSFSLFAEQANSDYHIAVDGALVISYQGNVFVSLIGESSLLINRNGKSIYNMSNTEYTRKSAISLFTDYISGQIHIGDSVLILGYDHTLLFHAKELYQIAQIVYENEPDMLMQLENTMTQRAEEKKLGFMSLVKNISQTIDFKGIKKRSNTLLNFMPNSTLKKIQHQFQLLRHTHAYALTMGVIGILVLSAMYGVIAGALNKNIDHPVLQTPDGIQIVSIDDIKRDVNLFVTLHPEDPTKGEKYKSITDRLEFLKSQGRWLEDVTALQKIVQEQYMEGFNIIAINDLADPTGEFKPSYLFSDNEKNIIGDGHSIYYDKGFYVGGTKGSLIKGINNDVRGTSISYALTSEMQKCSQDLSRSGLYCFDDKNAIYRITAGSVQLVSAPDAISIPTAIQDIGIFGRNNLYLLINPQVNAGSDLIRRYTIQGGNFSALATSLSYTFAGLSGATQPNFTDMTVDGSFLTRSASDKQIYQMRRNPANNSLNSRIIPIKGGDTTYLSYSDNVRVIAPTDSRYVYLFDKSNKTLTVYSSNPLKTTQGNQYLYDLTYIMRYTFDTSLNITNVVVPDGLGTRPILYVLSPQGIYETNIGESIAVFENL